MFLYPASACVCMCVPQSALMCTSEHNLLFSDTHTVLATHELLATLNCAAEELGLEIRVLMFSG